MQHKKKCSSRVFFLLLFAVFTCFTFARPAQAKTVELTREGDVVAVGGSYDFPGDGHIGDGASGVYYCLDATLISPDSFSSLTYTSHDYAELEAESKQAYATIARLVSECYPNNGACAQSAQALLDQSYKDFIQTYNTLAAGTGVFDPISEATYSKEAFMYDTVQALIYKINGQDQALKNAQPGGSFDQSILDFRSAVCEACIQTPYAQALLSYAQAHPLENSTQTHQLQDEHGQLITTQNKLVADTVTKTTQYFTVTGVEDGFVFNVNLPADWVLVDKSGTQTTQLVAGQYYALKYTGSASSSDITMGATSQKNVPQVSLYKPEETGGGPGRAIPTKHQRCVTVEDMPLTLSIPAEYRDISDLLVKVLKIDKDTKETLAGAAFKISDVDNPAAQDTSWTWTSQDTAQDVKALVAGHYYKVEETSAPTKDHAGNDATYTPTDPFHIHVVVSADGTSTEIELGTMDANGKFTKAALEDVVLENKAGTQTLTVANKKQTEDPTPDPAPNPTPDSTTKPTQTDMALPKTNDTLAYIPYMTTLLIVSACACFASARKIKKQYV